MSKKNDQNMVHCPNCSTFIFRIREGKPSASAGQNIECRQCHLIFRLEEFRNVTILLNEEESRNFNWISTDFDLKPVLKCLFCKKELKENYCPPCDVNVSFE